MKDTKRTQSPQYNKFWIIPGKVYEMNKYVRDVNIA